MDDRTRLKKTKIVATIGPVSENEKTMTEMVKSGMNVARLNFSHGDYKEHGGRIRLARKVSKKLGAPIAVLQDLSGPKIRIGEFYKEKIVLKPGQQFTLTVKKCLGDEKRVFVNYKNLPKELKKGSIVLLDDGKKKLRVESISANDIHCRVLVGGETKGKRGVNLPGAYLKISSITPKDKKDLDFGVKNNVDFVALSFVRRPEDIRDLRKMLRAKKSDAGIIAKIETAEAIENLDKIIELSDGIMVARGDLAIEVPAQDVPLLQKMIIKKCNQLGKPVITATQMLESMIKSPVPTRAEVSDVANSIFDGTDAVMLSEETTLGDYPVAAVRIMAEVALATEGERRFENPANGEQVSGKGVVDSVSESIVKTARDIGAKAIVALTESGFTARMISRFRPRQPIIVMSHKEKVYNKMALSFGCFPMPTESFAHIDQATATISKFMSEKKLAKKGDKVVIAAGLPYGKVGGTNMLLVHVV